MLMSGIHNLGKLDPFHNVAHLLAVVHVHHIEKIQRADQIIIKTIKGVDNTLADGLYSRKMNDCIKSAIVRPITHLT